MSGRVKTAEQDGIRRYVKQLLECAIFCLSSRLSCERILLQRGHALLISTTSPCLPLLKYLPQRWSSEETGPKYNLYSFSAAADIHVVDAACQVMLQGGMNEMRVHH